MSGSVLRGASYGTKEGVIPVAARQPEKTLGPGKNKQSKLSQDEEWPSIPASLFTDPIPTPQANEEGGSLPPPVC